MHDFIVFYYLHGTNVVQVSEKGKQATAEFVIPDLDFIVITARHKKRLDLVEVYSAYLNFQHDISLFEKWLSLACEDVFNVWWQAIMLTNRSVVLIEPIKHGAHAVIPQLNDTIV